MYLAKHSHIHMDIDNFKSNLGIATEHRVMATLATLHKSDYDELIYHGIHVPGFYVS